jgi:hypothetical protein
MAGLWRLKYGHYNFEMVLAQKMALMAMEKFLQNKN